MSSRSVARVLLGSALLLLVVPLQVPASRGKPPAIKKPTKPTTASPSGRSTRTPRSPREKEYEEYGLPSVPRERWWFNGEMINRAAIERALAANEARLAELKAREKTLQTGLGQVSPKLAHRVLSDSVRALVLEAQKNDAIAQFVETVVRDGERLSGRTSAVVIVERISELVRQGADRPSPINDAFWPPGGRGKRSQGSLAYRVVEMAAAVLAGVASGTVESIAAERLASALEPVGWNGYTAKRTLDEVLEARFRVVEKRERDKGGGDTACYDNARRLVLVRGADDELRPLCSWPN